MTAVMVESTSLEDFERRLRDLRPKLHRYCARMAGSAIDGEDVLQDALVNAVAAFGRAGDIAHPEAWLFRIAHNAAVDFQRARARHQATFVDHELESAIDPLADAERRQIAAAGLRTFMYLPPAQRSCVILMDVLDFSLQDICTIMGTSLAATKAALHRGRAHLRRLAAEPDTAAAPRLSESEARTLRAYIAHFNDRNFDAIRNMIAEDAEVDLVSQPRMAGRAEVAKYFGNYERIDRYQASLVFVDGQPAILIDEAGTPPYCALIAWRGDRVLRIRDFRYARYVLCEAEVQPT